MSVRNVILSVIDVAWDVGSFRRARIVSERHAIQFRGVCPCATCRSATGRPAPEPKPKPGKPLVKPASEDAAPDVKAAAAGGTTESTVATES